MSEAGSTWALSDALHRAFAHYAQNHADARCMLVLDPAARTALDDPAFASAFNYWQRTAPANACAQTRWGHPKLSAAHAPQLLALDLARAADAALCSAALQLALQDWDVSMQVVSSGHRIGAFLFTPHTADVLAVHLKACTLLPRPEASALGAASAPPRCFLAGC
jgi:hypothetical protein